MSRFHPIASVLSVALLAAAICALEGYFSAPSLGATVVLVCLALPLLAVGTAASPGIGRGLALLATLGGAALVVVGPFRLGGALVLSGGLLALLSERRPALARLAQASGTGGMLLVLGQAVVPLWVRLEVAQMSLDRVTAPLALLVRAAGGEARAVDGILQLGTGWGTIGLSFDLFKLGGLFAFLVLLFDTAVTVHAAGPRRASWRLVLASAWLALYAPVRLVVLALCTPLLYTQEILLSLPVVLASFVPLFLLWAHVLPRAEGDRATARTERRAPLGTLAATAAGVLAVLAAFGYHDAGVRRDGRVLLDESHTVWEVSSVPFNREHWGRASTYNYAEFAELLRRTYDFGVHAEGDITAEVLEGVQVLVLKTPSRPYTGAERGVILDYVRGGGGLWLVGDHTNLHGMSDILNPIAREAGMAFRKDATYVARTGWTSFNDDSHALHPTSVESNGMAYQTSCSLAVEGVGVEPALVGWRLTGELADYGNANFFGNLTTELEDRVGILLQAATGSIGRGRVAVFSDSTILSNFSLFDPGIAEFALRTVEHLRREERLPRGWREALALIGLAIAGAGAVRLLARGDGLVLAAAPILALGGAFAATHLAEHARNVAPVSATREPYRMVAFVEDASTFHQTSFVEEAMPTKANHHGHDHAAADPSERSISTLYTWVLRIDGVRPRRDASVAEALGRGASMIVLFDPQRPPTHLERLQVQSFVADGGVLLVLDDIRNQSASSANVWLQPFGLSLGDEREELPIFGTRADLRLDLTRSVSALAPSEFIANAMRVSRPRRSKQLGSAYAADYLEVQGGTPLVTDERGRVLSAYHAFGRGFATAFCRSSALTNAALGGRFDPKPEPQAMLRHLGALEILEQALDFHDAGKKADGAQ